MPVTVRENRVVTGTVVIVLTPGDFRQKGPGDFRQKVPGDFRHFAPEEISQL